MLCWPIFRKKAPIAFDYANVKLPLKREFFPQCETISRFGLDGVVEEKTTAKKTVLFGVRPCDVQSIAYLDKVFIDDKYQDPYYQSRRDNTLIIALACSSSREHLLLRVARRRDLPGNQAAISWPLS